MESQVVSVINVHVYCTLGNGETWHVMIKVIDLFVKREVRKQTSIQMTSKYNSSITFLVNI